MINYKLHSSEEAAQMAGKVRNGHHPSLVIGWVGRVLSRSQKIFFFCEKKWVIQPKRINVLDDVVKTLSDTLFENIQRIFQQDFAPSRKALPKLGLTQRSGLYKG